MTQMLNWHSELSLIFYFIKAASEMIIWKTVSRQKRQIHIWDYFKKNLFFVLQFIKHIEYLSYVCPILVAVLDR